MRISFHTVSTGSLALQTALVLSLCCVEAQGETPMRENGTTRSRSADGPTTRGSGKPRVLTEINLTHALTRDQVATIWGKPDRIAGSGLEIPVYRLDDGRSLWLWFYGPGEGLMAAKVFAAGSDEKGTIVFAFEKQRPTTATSATRRQRVLADANLTSSLTQEQIFDMWGKPDRDAAAGREILVYGLDDGRSLWLWFGPEMDHYHYLTKAVIRSSDQDKHGVVLFEKDVAATSEPHK